ncbi:Arm DNA-binding domain-containing protein [Pseudomonas sp. CFII64]|uniref:Arm DNA-binding domain-containing protein n=1 Tax=Pseudomonas sp. CFII64 TaxID=911242 RepID=UPI00352486B1
MPPDNAVVFKRKLSDALIRSLTEPGKHADGEVPGLYLEVRASSKVGKSPSKVWRLKYRLHGKENRFSIGAYPDISLKEARDIARGARRDVANHTAPLRSRPRPPRSRHSCSYRPVFAGPAARPSRPAPYFHLSRLTGPVPRGRR